MKHHLKMPGILRTLPTLMLALCASGLRAGPRQSANYKVSTETTDAGGGRNASSSYTNDGSVGGGVGLSTVASPAQSAGFGYVSQLYDVTGLTLSSDTTILNETAASQLSAWQTLDDLSVLAVAANDVTWSVLGDGPLSINAGGLAVAGAVYQNSVVPAQGGYAGNTATISLSIVNAINDNFASYGADGLEDSWQVQHFGLNNGNAGPLVDADQDGFSNLFEYNAGLVPTDAASVLQFHIRSVPGQSAQRQIIFSPRFADRSYTVKTSTSLLNGSWIALVGSITTDNESERTVTDLKASEAQKFYRLEIVKP